MLYLVATPIGNLEDMSMRAVRVLKEADLIACEDTRTSGVLLKHFDIHTPTVSLHKFNETGRSEELVGRMAGGLTVALISDAGMPGISDPGEIIVKKCAEEGIPVSCVPGACAAVTALALSGMDTRSFVFEGFLPSEKKERDEVLARLGAETRTIILYEAPHRLIKTLSLLAGTLGEGREVSLCRELTKKFETIRRTTLGEASSGDTAEEPRGEYVIVIAGKSPEEAAAESAKKWEGIGIPEHVALYEKQGMARKDAMRAAARDLGLSRRDIYRALLDEGDETEEG